MPVSKENELAVWNYLEQIAGFHDFEYGNQHDNQIKEGMNENQKNCIKYRKLEKGILDLNVPADKICIVILVCLFVDQQQPSEKSICYKANTGFPHTCLCYWT